MAVQLAADGLEAYVSAAHGIGAVLPAGQTLPMGHVVAAPTPAVAQYAPVHTVGALAPAAQNVPATHCVAADDPAGQ